MSIHPPAQGEECPLCGRPNGCPLSGSATYKGPCWCARIKIPDPLLARVPPEKRNAACICESCIRLFYTDPKNSSAHIAEAGDFYFDGNGLMVLTAQYHLRRGYCCANGCRHCPYPEHSVSTFARSAKVKTADSITNH